MPPPLAPLPTPPPGSPPRRPPPTLAAPSPPPTVAEAPRGRRRISLELRLGAFTPATFGDASRAALEAALQAGAAAAGAVRRVAVVIRAVRAAADPAVARRRLRTASTGVVVEAAVDFQAGDAAAAAALAAQLAEAPQAVLWPSAFGAVSAPRVALQRVAPWYAWAAVAAGAAAVVAALAAGAVLGGRRLRRRRAERRAVGVAAFASAAEAEAVPEVEAPRRRSSARHDEGAGGSGLRQALQQLEAVRRQLASARFGAARSGRSSPGARAPQPSMVVWNNPVAADPQEEPDAPAPSAFREARRRASGGGSGYGAPR
jgi:hypothetical protein